MEVDCVILMKSLICKLEPKIILGLILFDSSSYEHAFERNIKSSFANDSGRLIPCPEKSLGLCLCADKGRFFLFSQHHH